MVNEIFKKSGWIWCSNEAGENEYGEFYDKLHWEEGETILNISVRGDYTVFVNGEFVSCNQFADFEQYKIYDKVDITKYLKKGENDIGILVWYFGKNGQRYFTENPGLIYEILNGDNIIAFSDSRVQSRKSRAYINGFERKISPQLGYSFSYDADKEDNWINGELTDFSDSVVYEGTREFYKRPAKKLEMGDLVRGSITKRDDKYIVDLGREIVGLCSFSFVSPKAQNINISYGELLKDGHVKRIISFRDFSFDYHAKEGKNVYTNYMLRLAGRYIEIDSELPIEIEYIGIIPQYYPVKEVKKEFKNPIDKKIYEMSVNTLKLCMMEHYVDTPWREQCLYTYDSRNQMRFGFYAFEDGNAEYARANFLLMSKDKRDDGLLSMNFPSGTALTIPAFSLYYIVAVKEYTEYSRDLSLAEETFEKMESVLKIFVQRQKDGLVYNFKGDEYWNFYDWTKYANIGCDQQNQPDFIINSLFVITLKAFDYICKKLGKENIYDGIAEKTTQRAREFFYDAEKGTFPILKNDEEATELANSLAVISGIADENMAEEICEKLVKGELFGATLSMKPFKFDALLKVNKEKNKESKVKEIRVTFGLMTEGGTETVWEVIEGAPAFGNAGSLCHGWSAGPVYYYNMI